MAVAKQKLDENHLGTLSPFNSLSQELLEEVIEHCSIDRFPPGQRIFSEHDNDNRTIFLLSGQLALMAEGHGAITLKADSNEAAQPIAAQQPRQVTALASTTVTVLSIDSAILADILDRAKRQGTVIDAPSENFTERFNAVFNSPLFVELPEPHKQVLMRRMVEMPVKAEQVVVHEGDASDYYYLVVEGRCRITRGSGGQTVFLAELGPGAGFGEGALIENDYHDSTVTMLEDGLLLRLSKGEFLTLLVRPFIKWVQLDEMHKLQKQGSVVIDIRTPAAYQRTQLEGSINLPLVVLRKAAAILDRNRHYIVCCDVGRRSATAAFLLAEQGISVGILEGGIRKALQDAS